ncbi:MAG: hypothetical protein ACYTGZ_05845 [Planctomycetota bacterium]|jgi:hypothetical protein
MRIALTFVLLALPAFAGDLKVVRVPGVYDLGNKTDPVNGKKVGEAVLDWSGVRIRFHDFRNTETFKKDPKKYLKKLGVSLVEKKDAKGKVTATILDLKNKKCPVTGDKVSGKHHVDKNGVRVHTCCGKCSGRVQRNPKATAKALGYTWVPPVLDLRNTKCPVTGDDCYPEAPIWVDVEGIRVRVCCDHCLKRVEKDPARTFRALGIDPKKLKAKHAKKS